MADNGTSCPVNWTLGDGPVKGCGLRTLYEWHTCDSVLIPVTTNYSIVCGRIHAYQKGLSSAFRNSVSNSPEILGVNVSIDGPYVSGLSLTMDWLDKGNMCGHLQGHGMKQLQILIITHYYFPPPVPVLTLHSPGPMKFPLMLVTVTSVTLLLILILPLMISRRSSWATLSGMVRAVVGLAPAAGLKVLHGFVSI